jgi:hypothetical protein
MACFTPLQGLQKWRRGLNGGHGLTYKPAESNGNKLTVPCGQCIGCRIDQSKQWAIRIMHEASLHQDNQFLTLTYAPEHLPRSGSLQPKHFSDFMKRYRKEISPQKIRFFHCGEYGEKLSRPHYHAIIFGHLFADRSALGPNLFTSPALEKLWGKGFVTIGECTIQSAAYVARYVTKKITGNAAASHYQTMSTDTGELHNVRPEYVTMSRRPGIAKKWFDTYFSEVYAHDHVVHKGKLQRTPRYYDRLFREMDPSAFAAIQDARRIQARLHADNNTPERLAVRETVLRAKLNHFKRPIG